MIWNKEFAGIGGNRVPVILKLATTLILPTQYMFAFFKFFTRAAQKRELLHYTSEATAEALLNDSLPDVRSLPLQTQTWHLVLIKLNDDEPPLFQSRMQDIARSVIQSNGHVHCVCSCLVVIIFGLHANKDEPISESAMQFIDRVRANQAKALAVVHGRADCLFGIMGQDRLFVTGFVFRGFAEWMEKLLALPYGEILKIG